MTPTTLAFIEGLITLGTQAMTSWNTLKPILAEGREPTEEEWAVLNAQRDDAHREVQAQA